MIWDTAFEGTPAGSDFGSVTALKLRELKSLFKTMLSREHTFDETVTPVMSHRVGYCSIIGRDTEQIGLNALAIVEGTLKYNDGSQYLYLGTFNHQDLSDRDLDDAHTQYVLDADSVFTDIEVDSVSNIQDVTYPNTKDDRTVVRSDSHLNNEDVGDGSPNHADGCVPASDIQCTLNDNAVEVEKTQIANAGVYKANTSILRANLTSYDSNFASYGFIEIGYDQRDSGGSIQFHHNDTHIEFHSFKE